MVKGARRLAKGAFGVFGAVGALASAGCKPEFSERASEVVARRILAVQSEPAEAELGAQVRYRALVAGPDGAEPGAPLDWAYCTRPKPVSELNDVSRDCFVLAADYLRRLSSTGTDVTGTIPSSACRQFGPDIAEIPGGQGRPTDPDETGGFYQPLRLLLADGDRYLFTLAETRVRCELANATIDLKNEYRDRYRRNENPRIQSLVALGPGEAEPTPLESEETAQRNGEAASPYRARRAARIQFRVGWPACDPNPVCGNQACEALETHDDCPEDCPDDGTTPGCAGAEAYAYDDPVGHRIVERRESMRVSWYSTAGSFDEDRTGRTEEEAAATETENGWTAPGDAGPVFVWLVLRDDRGGVSWQTYRIDVQ